MKAGEAATKLMRQALTLLARREHSQQELRSKLVRWSGRNTRPGPSESRSPLESGDSPSRRGRRDGPNPEDTAQGDRHKADCGTDAALVNDVLNELKRQGLLSDDRFAESRIHWRKQRFGNCRIQAELQQHGVQLSPAQHAALRQDEVERARKVLAARYVEPPSGAADQARRQRFLAARGFSRHAIHQALTTRDD